MEETTTGMMKADVERIEYIKEKCTKVCGETYDIRRGLAVMDGMLSTLRFSTFDGTSYMDAIRRDTYKIDRLEDYSFGLTRYLEMVVDTDEDTNLQFLRKLNEYEELHSGEAGAITYNPINELIEKELMGEIEDYWNQGEEYFGENWWADENKKQEAFNILLLEASISGQETGGLDLMAFLAEVPYGTSKREAFMLLFQMIPDSDNDSIMPELISGACSRYGIDLPGNGWVVPYEVLVYHTLNHEEIQKMCDQNGKEVVSYTLNFFPVIGEIKSAVEAVIGKDLIAGTELSAGERILGLAAGFADALALAGRAGIIKPWKFGSKVGKIDNAFGGGSKASFASEEKLLSHYDKHGNEFKGIYNSADEYLQGARDVMNNGYKVEYVYKGETRTGYVQFMGNNSKGMAKFAFVGTNNDGFITTFHTESGKTFWKLLNGENIPVIDPK